jgi:hypothetical protein
VCSFFYLSCLLICFWLSNLGRSCVKVTFKYIVTLKHPAHILTLSHIFSHCRTYFINHRQLLTLNRISCKNILVHIQFSKFEPSECDILTMHGFLSKQRLWSKTVFLWAWNYWNSLNPFVDAFNTSSTRITHSSKQH